jgi:cold shock CspA family protein
MTEQPRRKLTITAESVVGITSLEPWEDDGNGAKLTPKELEEIAALEEIIRNAKIGKLKLSNFVHMITADERRDKQVWRTGTIKWYDVSVRRYGWITPDENGPDVFLPFTTPQLCGIRENKLIAGIRVRYKSEPSDNPNHSHFRAHRLELLPPR